MKRFILVSSVAVAGLLIGYRLMQSRHGAGEPEIPQPGSGEVEIRTSDRQRPSDALQGQSQASTVPQGSLPALPRSDGKAAKSQPFAFPDSDDAEGTARLDAQCHNWDFSILQREQAAREAEPRDEAWAYSTAQLLQQFAASHPRGSRFRVTNVDCRTTFCVVKASGPQPQGEAAQVFGEIMQEVTEQSWNSFTKRIAGSASGDHGAVSLEFKLQRRGAEFMVAAPAADAQLREKCSAWDSFKWNREEAVLHAEPKDYSMEEQVQQLAASHGWGLKFEITSLDCRRTFCDLKAKGKSPDAFQAIQEFAREAYLPPGSAFSPLGSSIGGSSDGDTQTFDGRLVRK